MERKLILALAVATAACSAPPAPTGAPGDASSPDATTATPTRTHPPSTPAIDDAPVADDATVPPRFRGEWALDAAACSSPGHESQLRIDADRIAFHESSGQVLSVAGRDSEVTIVAQLTGEGETREATHRFRLSGDGNRLTDTSSGAGMVRRRCE